MQTPMQELFSYLEEHNMTNVLSENQKKEWLEKERGAIVNACNTGISHGWNCTIDPTSKTILGERYFNQTYNQQP